MNGFHDRLLSERKRLGLSQGELATAVGVSPNTQLNYEKGTRKPDADYLQAVAQAGVDVAWLLTGQRSIDIHAASHPTPADTMAERLRRERQRLKLKLEQLSAQSGVDVSTILGWETGKFNPSADSLQRLHTLGFDAMYILLGVLSPQPANAAATLADDEQALLATYRQAPNAQAQHTARQVLAALVDSFTEKTEVPRVCDLTPRTTNS